MTKAFSDILDQCLEALERGELTRDECIAHFPQYRRELSDLLQISEKLHAAKPAVPSPDFKHHAQTRMQNLIAAYTPKRAAQQSANPGVVPAPTKQALKPRWALRLTATIFLIITLIVSGTGVASAASRALPGDTLFGVKTTLEEARLIVSDDEGDLALLNQYADERVVEIQALAAAGRYEDIAAGAQAYQDTSAKMAKAIGKLPAGERREALGAQAAKAHERRAQSLTELFDSVPEQGQKGIQKALEVGPPNHAGGPPDGKGKPDQTGCPPDDKGGRPENSGRPEEAGKPVDAGRTENEAENNPDQSGSSGSPDDKCNSDDS